MLGWLHGADLKSHVNDKDTATALQLQSRITRSMSYRRKPVSTVGSDDFATLDTGFRRYEAVVDVVVAVAVDFQPPLSAPSIAGPVGVGPEGGEAGAEAFSSEQDAPSKSPGRSEKRRAPIHGFIVKRRSDWGRLPFGYFSLAFKEK